MPELPEIEATVRLLDAAVAGATVERARAPGLATMRTFAPPLDALEGATVTGLRRRGKLLLVGLAGGALPSGDDAAADAARGAGVPVPGLDPPVRVAADDARGADGAADGPTADRPDDGPSPASPGARDAAARVRPDAILVVHLMSAGRLQLHDGRAGPRDRSVRIAIGLAGGGRDGGHDPARPDGPRRSDGGGGGRELRLREFGTRQAAWAALLPLAAVAADETLTSLGPDAWPAPFDVTTLPPRRTLRGALRDQRVVAGIGRSWADEILWTARIAPLRRCGDLDDGERDRLRDAIGDVLGGALRRHLDVLTIPIPDKLPMPLRVHRRVGEPCPRCGDPILAVHYEDDEMAYCATCQTGGSPYKDRRFSRLLKE
ncbi:MAG: DNA-formamidopyrimidine glycosylase [Solirubrobacteraceae bacterium]|nr:DNA-formamidopyrimidine glycosylase [Solirubrobacteraceae bacterium]